MYHRDLAPILLSVYVCGNSAMGESEFVGVEGRVISVLKNTLCNLRYVVRTNSLQIDLQSENNLSQQEPNFRNMLGNFCCTP